MKKKQGAFARETNSGLNKYSLSLVACVFLLFAIGILMVFDTTAAEVLDRSLDRSTHHAFLKQIAYAFVAFAFALGIYFLGYENVLRLSGVFLLLGTGALVLVFVPGFGQQINGANRWINLFGNSLQPSEFVTPPHLHDPRDRPLQRGDEPQSICPFGCDPHHPHLPNPSGAR